MMLEIIPPHNPAKAIQRPPSGDLPFLIESSSIQPTIAAGTPAIGPQQISAAIANTNAAIAFCP